MTLTTPQKGIKTVGRFRSVTSMLFVYTHTHILLLSVFFYPRMDLSTFILRRVLRPIALFC